MQTLTQNTYYLKSENVLHIRDGLHKFREQADQILENLDALSVRIDGYQEQDKSKSAPGSVDNGKESVNRRKWHEVEGQADTREAKPVGTYQEEMQTFIQNCVAEGREYGSNAEAFEEFKRFYDERVKVAGNDGIKGKRLMVENRSEKLK